MILGETCFAPPRARVRPPGEIPFAPRGRNRLHSFHRGEMWLTPVPLRSALTADDKIVVTLVVLDVVVARAPGSLFFCPRRVNLDYASVF